MIYLQWFAKELSEALIVKVRGVLGGDEGDLEGNTLLNRIMGYGQTMNGWLATHHGVGNGEEVWSIFVG